MKSTRTIRRLAFCLILAATASTRAMPSAASNVGRDYLIDGLPTFLGCGVTFTETKRDVVKGSFEMPLNVSRGIAYLSVNALPWATIYGGGGIEKANLGDIDAEDSQATYEAGLLLNVVDHEVMDPTFYEDRIRVNAGASYSWNEAKFFGDRLQWNEVEASATLSIINDIEGEKAYLPNSIGLYVGPAFTYVKSNDFEDKGYVGFLAGIEVFYNDKISFDVGLRHFDDTGYNAGLHVRF